ncbi:DNA-directed RNA polymerase iii subunit rpc2 [Phtheirospermum japonicum]|uniref:DNA-directed RNA polymerase n=1 Tax=Phtheirospermum japonicum TaxID=374723 RepID=A0A830DMQ9_9LAMI|nr:DNA-directed RNA polymerase iii subunit rpc2 [Phtheirospermum japonicum]
MDLKLFPDETLEKSISSTIHILLHLMNESLSTISSKSFEDLATGSYFSRVDYPTKKPVCSPHTPQSAPTTHPLHRWRDNRRRLHTPSTSSRSPSSPETRRFGLPNPSPSLPKFDGGPGWKWQHKSARLGGEVCSNRRGGAQASPSLSLLSLCGLGRYSFSVFSLSSPSRTRPASGLPFGRRRTALSDGNWAATRRWAGKRAVVGWVPGCLLLMVLVGPSARRASGDRRFGSGWVSGLKRSWRWLWLECGCGSGFGFRVLAVWVGDGGGGFGSVGGGLCNIARNSYLFVYEALLTRYFAYQLVKSPHKGHNVTDQDIVTILSGGMVEVVTPKRNVERSLSLINTRPRNMRAYMAQLQLIINEDNSSHEIISDYTYVHESLLENAPMFNMISENKESQCLPIKVFEKSRDKAYHKAGERGNRAEGRKTQNSEFAHPTTGTSSPEFSWLRTTTFYTALNIELRMVVRGDESAVFDDLQEKCLEIDKQALAAPVKNAVDKFQLVPEFLKVTGLVKQHLDSFNYFVRTQIKKIVQANDLVTSKLDPSIYLRYKDVRIGKPSFLSDGSPKGLTPHACRLSEIT